MAVYSVELPMGDAVRPQIRGLVKLVFGFIRFKGRFGVLKSREGEIIIPIDRRTVLGIIYDNIGSLDLIHSVTFFG